MTLVLTITNADALDNGQPTQIVLNQHGAEIGRSAHTDWSLPDPAISSVHCDVTFRDSAYWLADRGSTNGTFVNGAQRLTAPCRLADGDEVAIGRYRIRVGGDGQVQTPAHREDPGGWGDAPSSDPWPNAPPPPTLGGDLSWGVPTPPPHQPPPSAPSIGAPEAFSSDSGWPEEAAGRGGGDLYADEWTTPGSEVSGRGALAAAFRPSPAVDVWAQMAETNNVDWARGDFAPAVAPAPAPPPITPAEPRAAPRDDAWPAFLAAAGLEADDVNGTPEHAARLAGNLLRQATAGLVVMLEARARAKSELGASATQFSIDGTNPLKLARSPISALKTLFAKPQPGILASDQAFEDAYRDLQAHQVATLLAMKGALKATLERFSPASIRQRAESRGLLARIIPGARDAELWRAYEREFDGVARGSDEAFMDVFSKAFREAYERAAAMRR